MFRNSVIVAIVMCIVSCALSSGDKVSAQIDEPRVEVEQVSFEVINPKGHTIRERFLPPHGFERLEVDSQSYSFYLRALPLKEHGELVQLFDGSEKQNNGVYEAVIDLPIGKRDLHQCADAVMRLRAEYLYSTHKYEQIHFNLTNGFEVGYAKWKQGWRVKVIGNQTNWVKSASPSNTKETFWKYLEFIFTYAGTHSLSKELEPVKLLDMQIGDVFIQGGFPGHAICIIDMIVNLKTGEKMYMLAQSYMPAQELQVLKNPDSSEYSPWYKLVASDHVITPEWTFELTDLKTF